MEQIIYNIALTIGLTLLFIHSEPLILAKRAIGYKEEDYDSFDPLNRFLFRGITCTQCSSFWIGLIFFGLHIGIFASAFFWFFENKNKS